MIDSFVPSHLLEDLDAHRRARLTVLFPLAGVFAAFYVVPVYKLGSTAGAVALAVAGLVNLLAPWLLRRTGSLPVVGNLLAGTALTLYALIICIGGGPGTIYASWLAVTPVLALLLVGKRASLAWLAASVVVLVGLHALERGGLRFPDHLSSSGLVPLSFLTHLGLILGVYILVRLMEHGREYALAVVEGAQQEAEAAMRSSQSMARALQAQKAQIEDQARALRALDEAKSRFFANVSHELRTPLALIVGPLAQLHAEGGDAVPGPLRGSIEMMLRNGQRLQRLINQILDLATLEAGELALDPRPEDLVPFVRQHVRLYEALAAYQGVELAFEPSAASCPVEIDRGQVEKVLANLIGNALKFSRPGGRITVSVRAGAGAAEVAVADTGVGIAEEEQARIFDRFYQVEDSTTRTHEGTGIGLALAKELVELHGGTVGVESAPGRGSVFTVRLPLAAPAEPSPSGGPPSEAPRDPGPHSAAPEPERPADPLDRTTVLVVEDNADMRAFVRSVLEPAYRVLEAADGADGLARALADLPDLVLADVMMPVMDGLALSRALAADPATDAIPVVLLTARAAHTDRVSGLETGADAYLVKPFDPEVLRLQVDNLIARQHRLRARLARSAAPARPEAPAPRSAFEERVRGVIESRLTDPQLSVERLAEEVGLSRQQLHRRLRAETEETPVAYLRRFRLERAAELLRTRQGNVSEVAYAVGFNSLSYFSRCFREHFGEAPSAWVGRELG